MKNVLVLVIVMIGIFGMIGCSSSEKSPESPVSSLEEETNQEPVSDNLANPPPSDSEESATEIAADETPHPPPSEESETVAENSYLPEAPENRYVILEWSMPERSRNDNSPLDDPVNGYILYHGCLMSGFYEHQLDVLGMENTTYVIDNLPEEPCYFAVRAYVTTSYGQEQGDLSEERVL